MGDMADMHLERMWEEDIENDDCLEYYLSLNNDELVNDCVSSRKPIILGIRKYFKQHNKLSKKQRFVLAIYLASRAYDNEK